jgi:hypothetical protein
MAKVIYMAERIMAPSHERWDEFLTEMILRFEGCDRTHKTTLAVLQEMQGIDVDGTLEFFVSQWGICDCEVLSKVVPGNLPREHQQILIDGWIEEVQRETLRKRERLLH